MELKLYWVMQEQDFRMANLHPAPSKIISNNKVGMYIFILMRDGVLMLR